MTVSLRSRWTGVACSAPVAAWLLAQDFTAVPTDAASGGAAVRALKALWIAQALALSLLGPLQAPCADFRKGLLGGVALVLASLPVYALIWLCGGARGGTLGTAFIVLVGYASLLAAARALGRWEREQPPA